MKSFSQFLCVKKKYFDLFWTFQMIFTEFQTKETLHESILRIYTHSTKLASARATTKTKQKHKKSLTSKTSQGHQNQKLMFTTGEQKQKLMFKIIRKSFQKGNKTKHSIFSLHFSPSFLSFQIYNFVIEKKGGRFPGKGSQSNNCNINV